MKNRTNEQLCALAQKGDAGARSLLVEQNMGFLRKTAGELYRSMNLAQSDFCVDCEDLVQEGSIGLLSAAMGFDAVRGIKFLTYAAPAIRNAMTDPLARSPEEIYIKQEELSELYQALEKLSAREQTYLLYRFGFADDTAHPLLGTALHFHLTESRAKRTEEQALDNLWLELPWWF